MFVKNYADVFKGDERWRTCPPRAARHSSGTTTRPTCASRRISTACRRAGAGHRHPGAECWRCSGFGDDRPHLPRRCIKAGHTRRGSTSTSTAWSRKDFNSYGSRRGNHEVMIRGTFANIRLRNQLLDDVSGRLHARLHQRTATQAFIYDAAQNYAAQDIPLVVLGGKEYGSGSSRDWAAKGTSLLGVRAVITEILRAHPPVEPDRHGRHPTAVPRGRVGGLAGTRRHRDVRHHRHRGAQ